MEFLHYVVENALVLIPVLIIIGHILKQSEKIPDKYLPLILLLFGLVGCFLILGFNKDSLIQGILVTGAAVYSNQLFKQLNKLE